MVPSLLIGISWILILILVTSLILLSIISIYYNKVKSDVEGTSSRDVTTIMSIRVSPIETILDKPNSVNSLTRGGKIRKISESLIKFRQKRNRDSS